MSDMLNLFLIRCETRLPVLLCQENTAKGGFMAGRND